MISATAPAKSWLPMCDYTGYLPDMPDIIVGAMPPEVLTDNINLRYRPWLFETPGELQEFKRRIDLPIPLISIGQNQTRIDFENTLDQTTSGPSNWRFSPNEDMFALYSPAEKKDCHNRPWPFLVMVAFNRIKTRAIRHNDPTLLSRGRYTFDFFLTEDEALAHITEMSGEMAMRSGAAIYAMSGEEWMKGRAS